MLSASMPSPCSCECSVPPQLFLPPARLSSLSLDRRTCSASMFCGLCANSATVCTNDERACWYCSNTCNT
jgi:hypothetical protein